MAEKSILANARALADGNGRALSPLLAAWRTERSIALGNLIERFGTGDAIAKEIAQLREPGPSDRFKKRALSLVGNKADPRIASAIVGLVEATPFTAGSMRTMWEMLFGYLISKHADPRSIPRLERADIDGTFGATKMGGWMKAQITRMLVTLHERCPDSSPRVADEDAIAALVPAASPKPPPAPVKKSGRARVEDELLAEIAASLDDDGPRIVYADAIAERGDPARAELIQLQLARAKTGAEPSDHEVKLLNKHAATWLAPIAPVIVKKSWTFERGFLDAVEIYPRKAKARELAGHPLWSTVRSVELSDTGDPTPILVHPTMRNLRSVTFRNLRALPGLLGSSAPIEELRGVSLPDLEEDPALHRRLLELTAFPKLRLVVFEGVEPEQAQTLWSGGLDRKGMQLVIEASGRWLGPHWVGLIERRPKHATLTIASARSEARRLNDHAIAFTLSPNRPEWGLRDLGDALGLFTENDSLFEWDALREIVVRALPGWERCKPLYSSHPTAKKLIEDLVRHAKTQKIKVTLDEGTWPMVVDSD